MTKLETKIADCIANQHDEINLSGLGLKGNETTLKNITHLSSLYLADNQISDVTFLEDFKNLRSVNLRDNQIEKIELSFLEKMPKLEKLYLYGNPIKNMPENIFNHSGKNVLQGVLEYLKTSIPVDATLTLSQQLKDEQTVQIPTTFQIQKALNYLEEVNYAGYFDEMDKINLPQNLKSIYQELKYKHILGKTDWGFSQQLTTFAREVGKQEI